MEARPAKVHQVKVSQDELINYQQHLLGIVHIGIIMMQHPWLDEESSFKRNDFLSLIQTYNLEVRKLTDDKLWLWMEYV